MSCTVGQYHAFGSANAAKLRARGAAWLGDVVRTSEQQSDVTMAGAEWSKCTVGQSFGPTWSTHWFWLHVRIPTEEQDASFLGKPVHLRWEFEGEGMLYAANDMTLHMREGAGTRALNFAAGDAVVAFTGGGGDDALWRSELELVPAAKGGEEFYFYVECVCNGMFGSGDGGMIAPPDVTGDFHSVQRRLPSFAHAYGTCWWISR